MKRLYNLILPPLALMAYSQLSHAVRPCAKDFAQVEVWGLAPERKGLSPLPKGFTRVNSPLLSSANFAADNIYSSLALTRKFAELDPSE